MTDEKSDDEKQDKTISITDMPILGGSFTLRTPPKGHPFPQDDLDNNQETDAFSQAMVAHEHDDGVETAKTLKEIEDREKSLQACASGLAEDHDDPAP